MMSDPDPTRDALYPPPPQRFSGLLNEESRALHAVSAAAAGQPAHVSTYPDLQSHPSHYDSSPTLPPPIPKTTQPRLRKACDSCSARKVKCDESGPPCRSCKALDIPCTFDRPSRRRGPPNRHAEAIKRQRYGQEGVANAVGQGLASPSSTPVLNVESICPLDILSQLIDDYFTYIHPLIPLPHEPTFRAAFARRQDRHDRAFLGLTAAMVSLLVAAFPRRPRKVFTSPDMKVAFPHAGAVLDRCQQVLAEARGLGHLDKDLTLYDAITSYIIALAAAYVFDIRRARLYWGEAVQSMRIIGLQQTSIRPSPAEELQLHGQQFLANGSTQSGEVDYVFQELSRRLFWLLFSGYATMHQLGSLDDGRVMPPATTAEPYPPPPLETDDTYIFRTHVSAQPTSLVSELTAFNVNARIMFACNSLTALELAFGANDIFDWPRQRAMIFTTLYNAKRVTEDMPPELVMSPSTSTQDDITSFAQHQHNQYPDHLNGHDSPNNNPAWRRNIQYEIQKANIYATSLSTRSYLNEKFWTLNDQRTTSHHPNNRSNTSSVNDATMDASFAAAAVDMRLQREGSDGPGLPDDEEAEAAMGREREDIFKDLSILLRSVKQVNMEPNGLSFCSKIRAIVSTLLHVPHSRVSLPSLDTESVQRYLSGVLEILNKLDRLGPGLIRGSSAVEGGEEGGGGMEGVFEQDTLEEMELIHWASLRECQERFVKENGFFSNI
ncbi:MAG: hypothetical protein Q9160_001203 [Pyrenula sp. 1 TL-2023]